MYSLDASTGTQIWNYTTGSKYPSPAVADGKVYVGSSLKVYAFADMPRDIMGPSMWVPDGKIEMRDVALVARHFGDAY